jgi:hypothetical protein
MISCGGFLYVSAPKNKTDPERSIKATRSANSIGKGIREFKAASVGVSNLTSFVARRARWPAANGAAEQGRDYISTVLGSHEMSSPPPVQDLLL